MKYHLLTRHAHRSEKFNRTLGVGDIVGVETAAEAKELLDLTGGHSYGHFGFGSVSGKGYPYFSPVDFTLAQLEEDLEVKAPAAKGPSAEELKAAAEAEAKAKAEEEAKAAAAAAAKANEAKSEEAASTEAPAEEKPATKKK